MRGEAVDAAVSEFLLAAVNPESLALTLAVREYVRTEFAAADRQRVQRIEALSYQAELARSRYMEVDPKNRLVAATLEADWNEALVALDEAEHKRNEFRTRYESSLDDSQDARILELARDFRQVWDAPATPHKERKRLLALLIEDITLTREGDTVRLDLRLRGGQTQSLPLVTIPKAGPAARRRDLSKEAVAELEALLDAGLHDGEAAEELNRQGYRDSKGDLLHQRRIAKIRRRLNIPSGPDRQRAKIRKKGYVTAAELAEELRISENQVYVRASKGHGIARYQFKLGKRYLSMYRAAPDNPDEPKKQARIA